MEQDFILQLQDAMNGCSFDMKALMDAVDRTAAAERELEPETAARISNDVKAMIGNIDFEID